MNAKTYTNELGTLEVTGRMARLGMRLDTWRPNDGREPITETCFVTGSDDFSRRADHTEYNEKCSCCWLGFTHSINYHNSQLGG